MLGQYNPMPTHVGFFGQFVSSAGQLLNFECTNFSLEERWEEGERRWNSKVKKIGCVWCYDSYESEEESVSKRKRNETKKNSTANNLIYSDMTTHCPEPHQCTIITILPLKLKSHNLKTPKCCSQFSSLKLKFLSQNYVLITQDTSI